METGDATQAAKGTSGGPLGMSGKKHVYTR